MIKKMNVVASLWMIAIIAILVVFGVELNMFGFYVAAIVVSSVLVLMNSAYLIYGFVFSGKVATETQAQYR